MKISSFYSFLSENSYLLPLGIAGLTLVMLALTLLPSNFLGESRIWSYDKLGHLVLFGTWTYTLGLYHHISRAAATHLWMIFVLGVAFGILIEIFQYILPLNRHADVVDVLFDTIGCLLAVWLLKKTIPSPLVNDRT